LYKSIIVPPQGSAWGSHGSIARLPARTGRYVWAGSTVQLLLSCLLFPLR